MDTQCAHFHKDGKFLICSVIQELKEKRQAVKPAQFNTVFKKPAQNNTNENSDKPVPTT